MPWPVNHAAPYATWTITLSPKQASPAAGATPSSSTAQRSLKAIHVAKMDKDFQEIQYWSDGLTTERWEFQGTVLLEQAGSPGIYIFDQKRLSAQIADGLSVHFKSDFPELNWLSAKAYAGVKTYQGQSCYWFQVKSPVADNQSTPQAWVNVKTRLPMAFDDGMMLHVYAFQDTASRQAELPPRFAEALKNYQKDDQTPKPGMLR
jgi:hypothetical protein